MQFTCAPRPPTAHFSNRECNSGAQRTALTHLGCMKYTAHEVYTVSALTGALTGSLCTYSVHCKCVQMCRRSTRGVSYVHSTFPSCVNQLTAVRFAPGLNSVRHLRFTIHHHVCELFKPTVYLNYSLRQDQSCEGILFNHTWCITQVGTIVQVVYAWSTARTYHVP